MKIDVFENRAIKIEGTEGTQNENNIQQLEINVPEKYKDYNKKIVFVTDDGIVWDIVEGNTYKIRRNVSKYRYASFYIWLTKDEDDFRSVEKVLRFNDNQDASDEITDEEIGKVNTVINILEEEITKVENLDLDIQKEGNKSIITITKKDGSKKSIEIYDGNGEGGGGISKYKDLPDKPRINDVELDGNKTLEELGIQPKGEYITNAVNNLINYYLKTEVYSKDEVNTLIGDISTINIEVVQELPTIGQTNVIYLLPKEETSNDIYNEYIYINNNWELIGTTQIDLTGYAKEEWVNIQIKDFLNEVQVDKLITTALSNHYTKEQIDELLKNKANSSDIPTKTSELINDSKYQTETEVQALINSAIGTALESDY